MAIRLLRFHTAKATVIALAVLALGLVGWETQQTIDTEYRTHVQEVLSSTERTAQQLATRTAETFDQISRSTLVVNYVQAQRPAPSLTDLEQVGVIDKGVADPMFVTDVVGFVQDSTASSSTLYVADEDFFKQHRKSTERDVHIGPVWIDGVTGSARVPVTRRLEVNGRFHGIAAAMVDPLLLTVPYGRHEAAGTVVGILGADGLYRSRAVDGRLTFGEKLDPVRLAQRVATSRRTLEPTTSTVDGARRFVSSVKVDRYPLYAVVAVSAEEALGPYDRARRQVLRSALGTFAVVLLAAGMLLWLARSLDESRVRTRKAEAAFRAALDGSLDAIFILHAVRHAGSGELQDLRIVDCNDRAAAGLRTTRTRLLGERLGDRLPSARTRHLRDFEHVMRTRVAAQQEVQSEDPVLGGMWLHHQIVPLEDGVALISRDITEKKTAEAALAELSRVDSLTGLANRRAYEEKLGEAIARSERSRAGGGDDAGALALLYIDLDGFKRINDELGHASGDAVLVEVARRLKDVVRTTDLVARFGGDEFAVIAENAGRRSDIEALCQRIVDALSAPHPLAGSPRWATPSVGVALHDGAEDQSALARRADAAMYGAKKAGKARFQWSDGDERMPGVRRAA